MFPQPRSHQPTPLFASDDPEESTAPDFDNTLEDAARDERAHARERLRRELEREPTEEEIDDWLRRHTEGY